MAEARHTVERPLSPHLSIYRPLINMVMSIVHRITGMALYAGTLLLAAWLIAVAMGPKAFDEVNVLFAHPLGKVVLFGYTWALLHHMLGGVRHLIWDTISGFEIWQVDALCWGTIIGSVVLTFALWAGAFALHGWL